MAPTPTFSASFWNIENFHGSTARAELVKEHVYSLSPDDNGPDVISFCEIKDKGKIREVILQEFSDYDFALTDTGSTRATERNKSEIELLVGWKRGVFEQALFTQRVDLKGGRKSVRPGALLNVKVAGIWYSLLFLHTKSGPSREDYEARKKSFARIWALKESLDRVDTTSDRSLGSRLLVLGDKNTMGNGASIDGRAEVRRLKAAANENGMSMPIKEHDLTFGQNWTRRKPLMSNLDHVLTSNVQLKTLGNRVSDNKPYEVGVRGWNQLLGDQQALVKYEEELSDHSALYVEVEVTKSN